jgi:hypothetical protein
MQTLKFNFDNLTRSGDDDTANSQRNIMNKNQSNYSLYMHNNVTCDQAMNFATQMPSMMITMKNGCSSNVNEDSFLKRSQVTHDGTKLVLQQRSYLTVPFLGNGNVDCGVENDLKFGDIFREKKSVIQMMEMPFMTLDNYPILDNQVMISKATIDSQWMVGMDTREMYKNGESKDKK